MRHLAESGVLARASLAAALTTLAGLPRLLAWPARPDAVWYLAALLGWAVFVLWAFVFAWQERHGGTRPFAWSRDARLWSVTTAGGLVAALALALLSDPVFRTLFPDEFPAAPAEWLAFVLFHLGVEPLFLCFGPMALFSRLCRRADVAAALTVLFGVFILLVKLGGSPQLPPAGVLIWLFLFRVLYAGAWVALYLRGGVWPVWWLGLLVQARLLWIPAGNGQ